jgi:hypothetical protein
MSPAHSSSPKLSRCTTVAQPLATYPPRVRHGGGALGPRARDGPEQPPRLTRSARPRRRCGIACAHAPDLAGVRRPVRRRVLRARCSERSAEILRIDGGAITARAQTVRNAQAIAAIGNRLAVLSWTLEALLLQWLDTSLAPLGLPETIATAEPSSWIRFGTLYAAGENRIAVSYLVGGGAGELIQMPSGRSEPGEHAHHFLGRYDAVSHALADLAEVTPTATLWSAGAWLGDRLLLVHGATSAVLSIFELDFGARAFP